MDEMLSSGAPAITRCAQRVQALFHGHLIADSALAVKVAGAHDRDVYFFPREDVEMEVLRLNDRSAPSAFGQARYFTINRDGKIHEDNVWTYEDPNSAGEDVRGMIAFDPEVFEFHMVEGDSDRMWRQQDKMADYIRHTDSGSGISQAEHWPANVSRPDDEAGELPEDDARI